ncbi:SpvB/TcaC N-terminal domain-containing protein [Shewanella sp. YLB-07]|uniref:SpvB/TcaC N-terminal domain-containing protein n=1 Tax=Shewanella sp. YLB-07 TaxID=2601268 RepID=UPI00128D79C6|nr:SpvB/TcaC N-terminal domain-containing protein [Shewanella sp. YLB-07]MPY26929.1 toxin [Shewanella sp. YLB-07]
MSQTTTNLAINPPELPQRGGTINTAQTTPGHAGPTGDLQFSIPVPVSEGRGLAPSLALSYQTAQGNSPFGVGWQLPLLSIRVHTKRGVPNYDDPDSVRYVGPSGEVLEPIRDPGGEIIIEQRTPLGTILTEQHNVISYRSRVAGGYERYERWQPVSLPAPMFWLIFSPDGSLHCLGKSPSAQTSNGDRIAEWSIEESLSPQGEHIRYVYQPEDNADGVGTFPPQEGRELGALSYLTKVLYGNVTPSSALYCWDDTWPDDDTEWLFSVVFDYGQRSAPSAVLPEWESVSNWTAREDAFSDYHYGFEVRCHRLCHQIIMFHHFASELTTSPMPVRQLILSYDENPILSRLTSAQQYAYGENSAGDILVESHPALQITYQDITLPSIPVWQTLPPTQGINESPFYQLVDLYGEGLSGVLYRSGTDWRYRAPQRGTPDSDEIRYSDWESVAPVPSLQNGRQMLTDVTGNGRLDWMVIQPGLNGFFSLKDDQTWQSFTPFSAVPSELISGEGIFADITGAGLSDVAVIGPNSVRFYPNTREGFVQGETTDLGALNRPLPIQGRNKCTLVAFSDIQGSGKAQLVEIDNGSVHCWPNLGRGQFGDCITLVWPGVENFQPNRLYLVDIDGSGANDLLYANSDNITVYRNQSGNGFATPEIVALPTGLLFDDTCQLTFDDMKGTGGISVLLSVPHMSPAHYLLPLSEHKPYLIQQLNNQCGAVSQITYRHSGQEWLDEKLENPLADCLLPLPLYLVKQLTQIDNITGNELTQQFVYRHGLYDGVEREYRGFGYVESVDTQLLLSPRDTDTPALKTRRWYHVGRTLPLSLLPSPWNDDVEAYVLQDTSFNGWGDALSESDLWWAERALTGSLLREEVYGLDGSALESAPYSVQSMRYQVALLQEGVEEAAAPTLRQQSLEQLSYHYERISSDPSCQHALTLEFDVYGAPIHQISISYPRRLVVSGTWDAIYPVTDDVDSDDQQFVLRINESRSAYLQEETDNYSVIGLPSENRSDVIEGLEASIPVNGFSVEELQALLTDATPRIFAGQQKSFYCVEGGDELVGFTYPPRVEHIEVAEFDDTALQAYAGVLTLPELSNELGAAGYVISERVLSFEDEDDVWVVPQSYTRYLADTAFYLPEAFQTTGLVGETLLGYDPYHLMVTSTTDALGNATTMTVNYQQLQSLALLDINSNTQETAVSPLGAPVSSSFYDTENGVDKGFPSLESNITAALDVTALIDAAGESLQQEASLFARDEFSWQSNSLPLHQVTLVADDYPDIDEQQVQVQLAYSDGFGRALQNVQKVNPGPAYERTATGELDPIVPSVEPRWLVSGRVEYNNKGLVVRQYQPYFVDDWHYITDAGMQAMGVADTHYYDPLGREIKVVTAKGFERRQYYTPWFTVAEDENDTWSEVTSKSR